MRVRGDVHSTRPVDNARILDGRPRLLVDDASSALARPSCSPWSRRDCTRRWDPRAGKLQMDTSLKLSHAETIFCGWIMIYHFFDNSSSVDIIFKLRVLVVGFFLILLIVEPHLCHVRYFCSKQTVTHVCIAKN